MKYPKGHEFEYRQLHPSQIKCDPLYQRELDNKRVDAIVREFNGDLFNEPKVSYRDGIYWVFNGQHSIAAWRKYHGGEDKIVVCKVYKGMTWLEECDAFMKQNGISKDPTTNQKLRAAYNSKDPDVVDMVDRATLCGFIVDFVNSKTPTRIVATNTLFRSYKTLGAEAYYDMLLAIKEAWYGDIDAISQQVLTGMTGVYKPYYGHAPFNHNDLVKSLKRISPSEIIRNGKQFRNRTNTYAREIIAAYNKGKRYRLDDREL